LRDGLIAAGHRSKSERFADDDLSVSFFGRLFLPAGALGDMPPYTPYDLASDLEIELLTDLYNGALEQEPTLGPPAGALGPARVAVQMMVERLLRSQTFAGLVPERAFIGNLKQVVLFINNSTVKNEVLTRVHDRVTDDTRVLIGHSLGSVVAYEYLCKYQPKNIELLITFGSPLGIRNVIFDRLTPPPGSGGGIWPGEVTRWVNIADPNDVVALRKDLSPLFPPPEGRRPIEDRLVDIGGLLHHGIDGYLNTEASGAALANVL